MNNSSQRKGKERLSKRKHNVKEKEGEVRKDLQSVGNDRMRSGRYFQHDRRKEEEEGGGADRSKARTVTT